MSTRIKILSISIFLILPALAPVAYLYFSEETRVCGVDGNNYPSLDYARKVDVEVSYNFPCQNPKSENNLYERSELISFTGKLLDYYVNNRGAQFFLENTANQQKYIVLADGNEIKTSNNFLPGDQVLIAGMLNNNTGIIKANSYTNASTKGGDIITADCEVLAISSTQQGLTCLNDTGELEFTYNEATHLVAGLDNPAVINDIKIGDLIRIRFEGNGLAKTILVLQRGAQLYVKNHYFTSEAKFISYDPRLASVQVELLDHPESIASLLGDPSLLVDIKLNDSTRIVKKYFGKLNIESFKKGDDLFLAGRINDDSSLEAVTIKNLQIWK